MRELARRFNYSGLISYDPPVEGSAANPSNLDCRISGTKTKKVWYRHTGQILEIWYGLTVTSASMSAAGASGYYLWSLPSGFELLSGVQTSTDHEQAEKFGEAVMADPGVADERNIGTMFAYSSTKLGCMMNRQRPAGGFGGLALIAGTNNFFAAGYCYFGFYVILPVKGGR